MKTNRRRRSRPWERYMGFAKGTYVGSDKHLTIQVLLYFQYLTIAHRDVHPPYILMFHQWKSRPQWNQCSLNSTHLEESTQLATSF